MSEYKNDYQRIVFQTDSDGFYVGEALADPDPKNAGRWLIPGGCVELPPPEKQAGKRPKWMGYKWKLISI